MTNDLESTTDGGGENNDADKAPDGPGAATRDEAIEATVGDAEDATPDAGPNNAEAKPETTVVARTLGSTFAAIIAPFSGEKPYGEDATYGERCDGITEEIQKLTAASSKEISIDWKKVKKLCIEVLTGESKDLRVACYLTVALFRADGYPGARDGLEIVHSFVADHWEGIFPPVKKLARRANDLRFIIDRLTPLVNDRKPQSADFEHIQAMLDTASALGELSRKLLLEKDPRFGELVSSLRKRVEEAPTKLEPKPAPPEPGPEPQHTGEIRREESPAETESHSDVAKLEPVASAATTATSARAVSIDVEASVSTIRSQLEVAIKPLRDSEPLSPVPYQILRLLKWEGVTGPTSSGKTQLPGPRSSDLEALQTMYGKSNWPGLLDKSENLFRSGFIWFLDLQRYTALSLENLDPNGPQGHAVAAVKEAVNRVLKRNPTLVDCTFNTGTPFASEETRRWLAEIATEGTRVGVSRESSAPVELIGLKPEKVEEAITLLRGKRLTEGMEVLQRGVEDARGPRAQFRARLDAATACLDANQALWARPILESLRQEIGTLSFELWERPWAIELHQLLAICYGRLAKATSGEQQEIYAGRLNDVKDALLRLDMQAAAAVEESI